MLTQSFAKVKLLNRKSSIIFKILKIQISTELLNKVDVSISYYYCVLLNKL